MSPKTLASTVLTLSAALNTWATPAAAKNRCEADLSRVQNDFCIGDQHLQVDGRSEYLQYDWKLDDGAFDLTSKVCLSDGGNVGDRKDMILALDRSQGIKALDSSHRKIGADNISTSRYLIEKLIDEAKERPEAAPKVGIIMFSTEANCQAWDGAGIIVNRAFPCLYVKADSIANEEHGLKLLAFLKAAEGKYSQGGAANSDLALAGDFLATGDTGLDGPKQAGLILFSDGRSYRGEEGDPYAYLKSVNYTTAQSAALSAFSAQAVKKYKMVFALNPVESPMYSAQNHGDAYSTMCAANGAPAGDCSGTNPADAQSWPVNRLDLSKYARSLVEATGAPASNVVTVNNKQDIDVGLEALRVTAGSFAAIDAVAYAIDGGDRIQGSVDGGRIGIENLPVGEVALELFLASGGAELRVPMTVTTTQVEATGAEYSDREMYCAAVESETEDPGINLNNLQGGSASCGVVQAEEAQNSLALTFAMLLPLGLALIVSGRGFRLGSLGLMLVFAAFPHTAKAEGGGLNALQYSPVVDGVAMTEKATAINPGTYNFGLFMDYANDPVEIGGEKNERINSIMDNLVTAHAVGNIGLLRNVSLGVHVPYVHNSDEERAIGGDEVEEGGQVGRPADASVNFKITFVRKDAISFGFMPIVTLPTGDEELLLGDGTTNYGGLFLFSGARGLFTWAFDTGYLHREKALELKDERTNSVKVTGQFLNHAGVEYRYSPLISFGGNLQAKFTSGEHIDFTRSNPAEWLALAKLRPSSGLDVQAGFGTGIGKGYGSPDYRVFGGLTYVPDATRRYTASRR